MKANFEIENLKCSGCSNTIMQALLSFQGLSLPKVEVDKGAVSFDYDAENLLDAVKEKLQGLGYPEKGSLSGIRKIGANARSYVSCAIGKFTPETN